MNENKRRKQKRKKRRKQKEKKEEDRHHPRKKKKSQFVIQMPCLFDKFFQKEKKGYIFRFDESSFFDQKVGTINTSFHCCMV